MSRHVKVYIQIYRVKSVFNRRIEFFLLFSSHFIDKNKDIKCTIAHNLCKTDFFADRIDQDCISNCYIHDKTKHSWVNDLEFQG